MTLQNVIRKNRVVRITFEILFFSFLFFFNGIYFEIECNCDIGNLTLGLISVNAAAAMVGNYEMCFSQRCDTWRGVGKVRPPPAPEHLPLLRRDVPCWPVRPLDPSRPFAPRRCSTVSRTPRNRLKWRRRKDCNISWTLRTSSARRCTAARLRNHWCIAWRISIPAWSTYGRPTATRILANRISLDLGEVCRRYGIFAAASQTIA